MIPKTTEELLSRAQAIAGLSFGELATQLGIPVPPDLKRDKGFRHLGIELKTIPINAQGYPLETTFVSLAPLIQNSGVNWQNSHVRHKLSRVLWIPIEGSRSIPLAERRIGTPILWQPSEQQERQLQRDWEELMDYIVLGQLDKINARLGEVLQLRPKGANSKSLTKGIGKHGEIIDTLPLGFYLRKAFTHEILQQFVQQRI